MEHLIRRGIFVARGAFALRPALAAAAQADVGRVTELLEPLRRPGKELLLKGAVSAAVRGARWAERRRQWLTACKFWVLYDTLTGDTSKAVRNMRRCARQITAKRVDEQTISRALQVWRLVSAIERHSLEARQGIAWCHAGLARHAEARGDFQTAKRQWAEVLYVTPDDPDALESVSRLFGQSPPMAKGEETQDADALYRRLENSIAQRAIAPHEAAQALIRAGAPDRALEVLERCAKHDGQVVVPLFHCLVALGRLADAAELLTAIMDTGKVSALLPSDVEVLLADDAAHIPTALMQRLATSQGAESLAPILVPALVARSDTASVLGLAANAAPDAVPWPAPIVLQVTAFLRAKGEEIPALRLLALFSGTQETGDEFHANASELPDSVLEGLLRPEQQPEFVRLCLAVAEAYVRRGDLERAVGVLRRPADVELDEWLAKSPASPGQSGDSNRARFSRLVVSLAAAAPPDSEVAIALAKLVVSRLPVGVSRAFAAPRFAELVAALVRASTLRHAPESSRTALLREHCFEHHLERHQGQDPEKFPTDLAFADCAIRYFEGASRARPADEIPFSPALRARLSQSCLPLGEGHYADLLMSCAMLEKSPTCDLRSDRFFGDAGRWYMEGFMRTRSIPSDLLGPDLLAHFNAVRSAFPELGVAVTAFARDLWKNSGVYRVRFDLANALDALLFTLELLSRLLPECMPYRALLSAMLPPAEAGASTFADTCIAVLTEVALPKTRSSFAELLCHRAACRLTYDQPEPAPSAPANVLLIGYGGAGTGLGRNMRMLKDGLELAAGAVTALPYELEPALFAQRVREWRLACRGVPIVVIAINAQDVPDVFMRDRYQALESSYVAGFFLWETNTAPRVQHLGIRLVDEIWTPTSYVAQVYEAHSSRVHVVGKGLYPEAGWPASSPAAALRRHRFLTVFDFHSSIERKNPLAVVLAFQQAFPGTEPVELVVKASNVDPQHPGNVSAQWERMCAAAAGDRRIKIVTERYTERQMRRLMHGSSCVISLHRSEGFGYVLADALALGIPVIGTAYSGNVDFCDEETSHPVPFQLVPVKARRALWETPGTEWAEPDLRAAASQMRRVFENYPEALRKAAVGRKRLLSQYSLEVFGETLRRRMETICAQGGRNGRPAGSKTSQSAGG